MTRARFFICKWTYSQKTLVNNLILFLCFWRPFIRIVMIGPACLLANFSNQNSKSQALWRFIRTVQVVTFTSLLIRKCFSVSFRLWLIIAATGTDPNKILNIRIFHFRSFRCFAWNQLLHNPYFLHFPWKVTFTIPIFIAIKEIFTAIRLLQWCFVQRRVLVSLFEPLIIQKTVPKYVHNSITTTSNRKKRSEVWTILCAFASQIPWLGLNSFVNKRIIYVLIN